ncbi:MAG: hypothetical protein KGV59_03025 [Tenacibaculum sp.]|nr:hypothetical protein [Tenacibaculum sp.]
MKKNIFIFCFILLISCDKETIVNDCFRNVTLNQVIYLNNPEFNNLAHPGLYMPTNIQGRRVLIINRGTSGYKAFDLECPEKDCNTFLEFKNLDIKCFCSGKKYEILSGGAPKDREGCSMLEYVVRKTSPSTLHISR